MAFLTSIIIQMEHKTILFGMKFLTVSIKESCNNDQVEFTSPFPQGLVNMTVPRLGLQNFNRARFSSGEGSLISKATVRQQEMEQ